MFMAWSPSLEPRWSGGDMSDPGRAFKGRLYRPAKLCERSIRRAANQTLANSEGEAVRVTRHAGLGILVAAAALALAARAAGDGSSIAAHDALVGEYRHSAASQAGKTRRSVATIAPRGAGLSIAWQEDQGNLFGGIGISLDGVFGAAYTEALNGTFRGNGVLAYRITGGRLDGLRLPYAASAGQIVHETLQGSPTLEGRYEIMRSVDADGATYHSGHVEIEHRGDTYQMIWYTPERSFEGVGLRVGDVLVAGYAKGFAPGLVAYCIDHDVLTGVSTYGHSGTIGADFLLRSGTDGDAVNAQPSVHCRDAVGKWNPSLSGG
jgi:hypothetical protein